MQFRFWNFPEHKMERLNEIVDSFLRREPAHEQNRQGISGTPVIFRNCVGGVWNCDASVSELGKLSRSQSRDMLTASHHHVCETQSLRHRSAIKLSQPLTLHVQCDFAIWIHRAHMRDELRIVHYMNHVTS